ncbi:L-2-hydroxyisocaproate dehydrogenase [Paucilactobacillus suebicus DSM 5007 = KCTC 3549]|uniref:L-2-hydroxyisocaproate dehydrogenase n=1 Tax=Paucilactobacillus suebicus DSM 5007 = KCTC 3549 TaxID=1423807 RepID=A0A0R1W6W2_9LACO|nr:L-2-hydroxyisocaproate dehydrogenase [Paucilactobacillus suebicus DSM 5007 = KCTC 3549]
MRRAVSEKLHVDPRSVEGYNLGEHGNSQFTAWSTVNILGEPMVKLAKDRNIDLEELNHESVVGGHRVFHGNKYTNYGVATAAVRLANTIISDAHTQMVVSNYREEYGTYLSYPAIVGRDGILEQVQLHLTDEELEKLQISANYIKQKYAESRA